jgi:hypothetical protein
MAGPILAAGPNLSEVDLVADLKTILCPAGCRAALCASLKILWRAEQRQRRTRRLAAPRDQRQRSISWCRPLWSSTRNGRFGRTCRCTRQLCLTSVGAAHSSEYIADDCAKETECRRYLIITEASSHKDQGSDDHRNYNDRARNVFAASVRNASHMPQKESHNYETKTYDQASQPKFVRSSRRKKSMSPGPLRTKFAPELGLTMSGGGWPGDG